MSRRRAKQRQKEPVLADLPLRGGAGPPEYLEADSPPGSLDQMLFDEVDAPAGDVHLPDAPTSDADAAQAPVPDAALDTDRRSGTVGLGSRLAAGLADVAIQLAALGLTAYLCRRLAIPLRWDDWPPFLVLGLVFSFLYFFVPLAFWGRTPGMAWAGHDAQTLDGEPLTFGQTCLRWFGALLTLGLAGLPLLLAFGGRSLSDRLSDSHTVPRWRF